MTQRSRLPTPEHLTIPLSPDLYRLVLLKDGWDGEGSKAPTREALMAIGSIMVLANPDGGVAFELSDGINDYEITFGPDGGVTVRY